MIIDDPSTTNAIQLPVEYAPRLQNAEKPGLNYRELAKCAITYMAENNPLDKREDTNINKRLVS